MTGFLRRAAARLADLLWPRVCAARGCGGASDRPGRHLCSRCLAVLPFHAAHGCCRVCGAKVATDVRHDFVCEACAAQPPAFACARSALRYEEPADQLLQDFKYHRATWLLPDLADLLEGAVRAKLDFAAVDAVVPVPLHPHRLRERGFNQSGLLAEALARRLDRRFDGRSLVRVADTPHQARLDEAERRRNLRGAFAVPDGSFVRGRTVLLVDDVMTTGATLSCAARALLDAGAARVWCATVARAVRRAQ